jgi:hypothetical protein
MPQIDFMEIIKIIWPLIVIQIALDVFCIVKIVREGVGNLKWWIWLIIVLCINIFGPILFLIIGRRKGEAHD